MDSVLKNEIRSYQLFGDERSHQGTERIIQLTSAHALKISQVASLCFTHPWTETQIRHFLNRKESCAWAIEVPVSGRWLLVSYLMSLFCEGELDILSIACSPGFRRRKYARRLLEWAQSVPEVSSLSLEVETANLNAVSLYQSCGFYISAVRKRYYQNKRDAYQMRKEV